MSLNSLNWSQKSWQATKISCTILRFRKEAEAHEQKQQVHVKVSGISSQWQTNFIFFYLVLLDILAFFELFSSVCFSLDSTLVSQGCFKCALEIDITWLMRRVYSHFPASITPFCTVSSCNTHFVPFYTSVTTEATTTCFIAPFFIQGLLFLASTHVNQI